MKFKTGLKKGKFYFIEVEPGGRPAPVQYIVKIDKESKSTLICTPILSLYTSLNWQVLLLSKIINAYEVKREDMPLYISWAIKTPEYMALLKGGSL